MKLLERLKAKTVINENGCWLWTGSKSAGYGRINIGGKIYGTHRVSALLFFNEPLTSKTSVLHRTNCPNKHCWNPEHIYLGTQSDNTIDMVTTGSHNNSSKTHCKYGHPLTGKVNSSRDGVYRVCKFCRRTSALKSYHGRKSV